MYCMPMRMPMRVCARLGVVWLSVPQVSATICLNVPPFADRAAEQWARLQGNGR